MLDVHRPCTETPDETKGRVFVLTLGCDTDPLGSGIFLTPLQSKGGQRALDAQSALVQKHLLAAMSGSPNLRLFSDVLAAVAKRVQRVSDKESMGRTQSCIVSHPPAQDLRFLVSNDESILDPTAWTTFLKKTCLKLDDGWPESVQEQGLLLLVLRHYITSQYIKDVL